MAEVQEVEPLSYASTFWFAVITASVLVATLAVFLLGCLFIDVAIGSDVFR